VPDTGRKAHYRDTESTVMAYSAVHLEMIIRVPNSKVVVSELLVDLTAEFLRFLT